MSAGFHVMIFSPMRLHECAVDLFESGVLEAGADGFDEGGDAEVACRAQEAVAGADDEFEGVVIKDVVGEAYAVEPGVYEGAQIVGCKAVEDGGVGDAGADVVVDGEPQGAQEGGLGDKEEGVVFREVFKEQSEFAQAIDGEKVGIVDDGQEHFAFVIDLPCGLDEEFFQRGLSAFGLNGESVAEDLQGVVVGVQGAGDGGGDHAFGIVGSDGFFDDAFAGAGFAHEQAEAALLGVDFDGVEDALLMGEQVEFGVVEGVGFKAEM